MEHTLQSLFLYGVDPYLLNDILPTTSYKSTIQTHYSETESQFKCPPAPNHVSSLFFSQIQAEVNLPRPYKTFLSQLHSSFCSASIPIVNVRIEPNSSPFCSSVCRGELISPNNCQKVQHRRTFWLNLLAVIGEN